MGGLSSIQKKIGLLEFFELCKAPKAKFYMYGNNGNTINGDFLATLDDFIYPNINCHVGPK